MALRAALGFDFIHALRNRHGILAADVVWTHTESQHLAVLLLRKLPAHGAVPRPAVIAQTVWLFDGWKRRGSARHSLWHWLMRDAEVLTVHSPLNYEIAKQLFPQSRVELVKFGIRADDCQPPKPLQRKSCLSVLSVGNDRHRDWATLVAAVRKDARFEVRIVSTTASSLWNRVAGNLRVMRLKSNRELEQQYEWADMVVVPVKPNLHASGITALQEAVLRGLPVVCADAGGLRSYFSAEQVAYFESGSAASLKHRLLDVLESPAQAMQMAERAQQHLLREHITSDGYVRRHIELSRELVPQSKATATVSITQTREHEERSEG